MYMENYGNGAGLGISFAEYAQRMTQSVTKPESGGGLLTRIMEASVPTPPPPAPSDDRVSEPQPGTIQAGNGGELERVLERVPVRMPVVYADPPPDIIAFDPRRPINGGGTLTPVNGGPAARPRTPTEAMDQVDDSMNHLPAAGPLAPSGLEPRSSQPIGPAPVGAAPQKAGLGIPPGAMLAILGAGIVLTMMSKK